MLFFIKFSIVSIIHSLDFMNRLHGYISIIVMPLATTLSFKHRTSCTLKTHCMYVALDWLYARLLNRIANKRLFRRQEENVNVIYSKLLCNTHNCTNNRRAITFYCHNFNTIRILFHVVSFQSIFQFDHFK